MTPTEDYVKILNINGFRNTTEKSWPNHFQWRKEGKYIVPNVKVRMTFSRRSYTEKYLFFDYQRIMFGCSDPHIYQELTEFNEQTLRNILCWFKLSAKARRAFEHKDIITLHQDIEEYKADRYRLNGSIRELINTYDNIAITWPK